VSGVDAGAAKRRLRFGILGAGSIAGEVADALAQSRACRAEAVASRDPARAHAFAGAHGVARALDGYEQLLADRDVDVVYVATPHTEHLPWASAALRAGKAVLCEKPLTVNARQARELIALAEEQGLFLLEAFAYRFHPQTHTLLELVRDGAIGQVRALDVTFSYQLPPGWEGRNVARALAGGGILDVGCYCTSLSHAVVAAATGAASPEPVQVAGLAVLHERERTDLYANAVMRFAGEILASLACGVALAQDDHIRVYGSEGSLYVPYPCWLPWRRDANSTIELQRLDGARRTIEIPSPGNIFAVQADGVAAMLAEGADSWRASWQDSLANMRTLDRWRAAAGVSYPADDG
jgi:predicted dehydrogenase